VSTTSQEIQVALSRFLIARIRSDRYPSSTHMNMVEQTMPPELTREYVNVLLDKVITDRNPSIPMLKRIQRIAGAI
jgi:hypothetical protein